MIEHGFGNAMFGEIHICKLYKQDYVLDVLWQIEVIGMVILMIQMPIYVMKFLI